MVTVGKGPPDSAAVELRGVDGVDHFQRQACVVHVGQGVAVFLDRLHQVPDGMAVAGEEHPGREGYCSPAGYDVDGTGVGPAVVGSTALEAEI